MSKLHASHLGVMRTRWQGLTLNARVLYYLRILLREERLDAAKQQALQLKRLRALLLYVNDSFGFYRQRFADAGFDPQGFNHIEQLAEIPVLEKEDYRVFTKSLLERLPNYYSSQFTDSTSGSTGEPLQVFRSWDERAVAVAKWMRVLRLCGFKTNDRTLSLTNPHRIQQDSLLQKYGFMKRFHVSQIAPVETQVAEYQRVQPDIIYGNKTLLLQMALYAQTQGIELPAPRVCISAAETLDESSRKFIASAFGVDPAEAYGAVELGNLGWRLSKQTCFYFSHTTNVLELEGRVFDGSAREGHCIITDLTTRSMPLIRYQLGDYLSTHLQDGLEVINQIGGRLNDWIILPDGTRRMFQPFWNIFRKYLEIVQFRVVQDSRDKLRVLLVRNPRTAAANIEGDLLKDLGQKEVVPGMEIKIEWVNELPRDPSGKLRVLINNMDESYAN